MANVYRMEGIGRRRRVGGCPWRRGATASSILSVKQLRLGKLTLDLTIDWFDQHRNCGTSALDDG
jgi:hypothetical protein